MCYFLAFFGLWFFMIPASRVHAAQPLETETARLLEAGTLRVETTFEFQTSSQGQEYLLPLAFTYGLRNDLELVVEPVVYSLISPRGGGNARGLGDTEITLIYRFFDETPVIPALAIAGEAKIPTTHNKAIGTGEVDFGPTLIASKQFGKLDTHLNLGYFVLGNPSGVKLKNIVTYAAAAVYHLNSKIDLVGEVIGNTSSSPRIEGSDGAVTGTAVLLRAQETGGENTLVPEATGEEVSGMLGARYYLQPNLFVSLGVTYDNSNAVLIRPGLTYWFH